MNRRDFIKNLGLLGAAPSLGKIPEPPKPDPGLDPVHIRYLPAFPRAAIKPDWPKVPIAQPTPLNVNIDFSAKKFYLKKRMWFLDFYKYIRNIWDRDHLDLKLPMYTIAPHINWELVEEPGTHYTFDFNDGWDFGDDFSRKMIISGGWESYPNIYSLGIVDNEKLRIYYRSNKGQWVKFRDHMNLGTQSGWLKPNLTWEQRTAVNEVIKIDEKSWVEFAMVDEDRAVIEGVFTLEIDRGISYFIAFTAPSKTDLYINDFLRFRWDSNLELREVQDRLTRVKTADMEKYGTSLD